MLSVNCRKSRLNFPFRALTAKWELAIARNAIVRSHNAAGLIAGRETANGGTDRVAFRCRGGYNPTEPLKERKDVFVGHRVGIGDDLHRLTEGRPLFLGGVEVPFERGLLGHSDADVVLHAVCDALLGAAALGDIGEHFPDDDPQWKGADSSALLRAVLDRVRERGLEPVNCDVVIHAQRPKLGSWKGAIRDNLARLLELPSDSVNVKAKTGEHVGPVGRGEAVSSLAIVLCRLAPASASETLDKGALAE